jgi:Putative adhesin
VNNPNPRTTNPFRRLVIIVGVVILLVAIAAGVSSAAAVITRKTTTDQVKIDGTIRRVVIDLDAGSISLTGTGESGATGTRKVEKSFRSPTFSEKLEGDTLNVKASCPTAFFSDLCSVSYELSVPADVIVEGRSSGGRIRTTGMTGDLDLKSSAGSVDVTGAKGRLILSSSAGGVTVKDSRSTDVKAHSSAGSVRVGLLDPATNVDANSSAGSVTVALPRSSDAYNVDASSSAGSETVDVDTSASSPRTIRAKSSAGSVTVTYGTVG